MKLFQYEDKLIRLTDSDGNTFTGIAESLPPGYCLHEYNREEEGIRIGEYVIFESDIQKIEYLPTYEEAAERITPGIYQHYKGNYYEVLSIARHSETTETMVVYRALYGNGDIWVRPADMWNEIVERDGKTCLRFRLLNTEERVSFYEGIFDELNAAVQSIAGSAVFTSNASTDTSSAAFTDAISAAPADTSSAVLSDTSSAVPADTSLAASFNAPSAASAAGSFSKDLLRKRKLLEEYFTSGRWLADYEADEAGKLPPSLKRGVLSQDGVSDLLERIDALAQPFSED